MALAGKKVHSLDFAKPGMQAPATRKTALEVQREQEMKAEEAHKYRQQLLRKQEEKRDEEQGGGILSPGYKRERQTARMRKEQKKQKAGDGRNATFSECAFNMANILMVCHEERHELILQTA